MPDAPALYFIRRLSPDLAADLIGDPLESPRPAQHDRNSETGWDRLLAGAKQMGVGLKEVISGALFETKPKAARRYQPGSGNRAVRNLYGHYLLIEKPGGTIDICREPESYSFPRGCNVFIVADLVGMPIARFSGAVQASSMSVGGGIGQQTSGDYLIDLWLDPGDGRGHELTNEARERLGRFLANVLAGRESLTVAELVETTRVKMQPFLTSMLDVPTPGKSWVSGQALPQGAHVLEQAVQEFQQKASDYLGLTVNIRFRPGTRIFRHRVQLSEASREAAQRYTIAHEALILDDGRWRCPNPECQSINAPAARFCSGSNCAAARPAATEELRDATRWKLMSRDAHDLTIEIAFVSFGQDSVDADGITAACIDALWHESRRITANDLLDPAVLSHLNQVLNNQLTTGRFGMIGEFQIVYFGTTEEEWKRQIALKVRHELREIDADKQRLVLTDEVLALRELQLLRDQRDVVVWRQEIDAALDRARAQASTQLAHDQIAALTDLEGQKLQTWTELEKRRDVTAAAGEAMRFNRDLDLQAKDFARADEVRESTERRSDELAEIEHGLLKDDMVDVARRKAEQDAADLQARIDRLKAGVKLDEARQRQDIDLDRKRSELDLDQSAASLKAKLEIEKLRAMAEIDVLQREQQSKMSAAQLMALQASALADKGVTDALTQLASHDGRTADATAEARVAKVQTEMLERMMAMQLQTQAQQSDTNKEAMAQQMQLMMMAMQQQQSTASAAMLANQEAIKAAMLGQQASAVRLQEVQQQATDAAVAWSQRSIDAISQVAATKAGNPGSPAPTPMPSALYCPSCGIASTGTANFCITCGHKLAP